MRSKVFWSISGVTWTALLLVSIVFFTVARKALIERTFEHLESDRRLKAQRIESCLGLFAKYIQAFAQQMPIIESLEGSTPSVKTISHLLKSTALSDDLLEFRVYNESSKKMLGFVSEGVSTDRARLYTPELLQQAKNCTHSFCVFDIPSVVPSERYHSFWMTTTVQDIGKNSKGFLIARISFERLEDYLNYHAAFGRTGEAYLIDGNFSLLSNSRFLVPSVDGKFKVDTVAGRIGFLNGSGRLITQDYRGMTVLSNFKKINFPGLSWLLLSEMDLEEVLEPLYDLIRILGAILVSVSLLVFGLSHLIATGLVLPLQRLQKVMQLLSQGGFVDVPENLIRKDEIGQMGQSLARLKDSLQKKAEFALAVGNKDWDQPFAPTTEQDDLGKALVAMRNELRGSEERESHAIQLRQLAIYEGQEIERTRIAQELHDGVGQMMVAAKLNVGATISDKSLKQKISLELDGVIGEVRRISHGLAPSMLEHFGLFSALEQLCQGVSQLDHSSGKLKCRFSLQKSNGGKIDIPLLIERHVFRMVQECLQNILKHADATECSVHVLLQNNSLRMEVNDNGKGFDLPQFGNGLLSIRERANSLHGSFNLNSKKDLGTSIVIIVPLEDPLCPKPNQKSDSSSWMTIQ